MNKKPRIFVLCPCDDEPIGGVKQLYRHVDVLNKNGFQAFILHSKPGFRCTWFKNNTKIEYGGIHLYEEKSTWVAAIRESIFRVLNCLFCMNARINPSDYMVIPEVFATYTQDYKRGVKKVIFNQNAHYTFEGNSLAKDDLRTPYLGEDTKGTIVISEQNFDYLKYAFPDMSIFRAHYGIDPALFNYNQHKKCQIAFMPRKLPEQIKQVVNLLKFRGVLNDVELIPIENKSEKEVAKILRESLIFLSFSTQEGCAMPPMEAMACGCIIIGYHGNGSREYFKEEFSYLIDAGDTLGFAKTVERALEEYKTDKALFLEKGKKASEFVLGTYSLEREESDIVGFWKQRLKQ